MSNLSTSEKLRKRLNLNIYLKELTELAGRPVQARELGSVEQAATIREAGKKFTLQVTACSEGLFSDLSSDRFSNFLTKLHQANPSPVYLWSPRTIDCGALVVPSLSSINFEFEFTVNTEGILVILSTDLVDRLLLDFLRKLTVSND